MIVRMTRSRIAVCLVAVLAAAGGGWAIASGSGSDPATPAAKPVAPNRGSSRGLPQREVAVQPQTAARRRGATKP
jgi:hypothetical protein